MPKTIACLRAESVGNCSIAALTKLTFPGVLAVLGLPLVQEIGAEPVLLNAYDQRLIALP